MDYSEIDNTGTAGIVDEQCKHSFVKVTGKKSKKVTWICIHCQKQLIEEVKPITESFKIKK